MVVGSVVVGTVVVVGTGLVHDIVQLPLGTFEEQAHPAVGACVTTSGRSLQEAE